jgi:hypothetical protein
VIDLVDLQDDPIADVVSDELEARLPQQVTDVLPPAGEEVVEARDLVSRRKKSFTKM